MQIPKPKILHKDVGTQPLRDHSAVLWTFSHWCALALLSGKAETNVQSRAIRVLQADLRMSSMRNVWKLLICVESCERFPIRTQGTLENNFVEECGSTWRPFYLQNKNSKSSLKSVEMYSTSVASERFFKRFFGSVRVLTILGRCLSFSGNALRFQIEPLRSVFLDQRGGSYKTLLRS